MLRQEVRVLLFLAIFLLLVILLFQLHLQSMDNNRLSLEGFDDSTGGRNLKSYPMNFQNEGHHNPHKGYKFDPLPNGVINAVNRFLFFVGYARSGHSIIASMLDAHPSVVLAHEYSLFTQWQKEPALHANKTWLFNGLYNNSRYCAYTGLRTDKASKKGYTLSIPGWWQGSYDGTISVIGDKAGGMTAKVFRMGRGNFISLYRQLQTAIQIPIHVIYVVRNPYDNIATMLLYNHHLKKSGAVNKTYKYDNYEELKEQIISYFNQVQGVVDMIDAVNMNLIEIHTSDFIANPKSTIRRLCLLLHIECSEEYLHMCSDKAYPSESRSRNLVEWPPDLDELVASSIQKYDHLKRYSFYT